MHAAFDTPRASLADPLGLEEDAAVIARSLEDSRAFRVIFDRHHDLVHRFLVARVGIQAAEDLVGETFIAAWRSRARFDAAQSSDARWWLVGIATNIVARHRQAEHRWRERSRVLVEAARSRPASEWHETGATHVRDALAQLLALDIDARLVEALGALRRRDRDVFLLHALLDWGYAEIAAALDISMGTVASRMNRARRKLSAQIEAGAAPP